MCVFNSGIAKVGTGMVQTQPILYGVQSIFTTDQVTIMLQVPPSTHKSIIYTSGQFILTA